MAVPCPVADIRGRESRNHACVMRTNGQPRGQVLMTPKGSEQFTNEQERVDPATDNHLSLLLQVHGHVAA